MGHTRATSTEGEPGTLILLDDYAHARASTAPALRLLIADGHSLARAGLRALLQAHRGISVIGEASTFEQAAALARRIRPDVAIIDAGLSDRVELIGRLRTESGAGVMLLTDSDGDEWFLAALRAGAQGVLLRDSAPDELVAAIEAIATGGASLSPNLARRLVSELAARPEPHTSWSELLDDLTPREREVLALVALGLTNAEIAEQLVITRATAKTHVSRVMIKLHARHRAQLVVVAYEAGLVAPGVAA
jgi:DNA-binding NarL/FixJ family response regulator